MTQINTKMRDETIQELEYIASQLTKITGEKVGTSSVIRYFVHKGIINEKFDLIHANSGSVNFKKQLRLYDAVASMKAYDYSKPGAREQMEADHRKADDEAWELSDEDKKDKE